MAIHYVRLGQNIRTARNKVKMTQRAAVEELSINSVEHYSHLECGNRRVQLETLDDICKLYNVSYEELLKGATDARIVAQEGSSSGADNERTAYDMRRDRRRGRGESHYCRTELRSSPACHRSRLSS